ncbi:MAG: stage IV sporulation protein A [Eubacteriales bacterium]|nr:stage IV sporulation protein A [Eubacteriales bacterium]
MEQRNIYKDIARRTGGDIYIGVVGPVRTGKSTFTKRFMDTLVIPNIGDDFRRERAQDELPQSSAGRTIMTTEPKFIPEDAVDIDLGDNVNLSVRMIDCVGYVIPEALGYMEEDTPRMVKTPWFEEEIPFEKAAEYGTSKVINDHSTIGLVITTDGSIGEIEREAYIEAEERVVNELKEINKPFVILLNTTQPTSQEAIALSSTLSSKYMVPVIPISCLELDEMEIKRILAQILLEFPVSEIEVDIPSWILSLPHDHWLKSSVLDDIRKHASSTQKLREVSGIAESVCDNEYITASKLSSIDLGQGKATISVFLDSGLFYKVLSEETGLEIPDERALLQSFSDLRERQSRYERIAEAYENVLDTGYGIVMPTMEELELSEPEIIKQSGKYGVKLKASAPSVHMMRIETTAQVTPIVGSEQQSEDLVKFLLKEFEEDPVKIWESDIFGKSVHELVNEGLQNKLYRMPTDARRKLCETMEKIINDGCNGLICIIL